MCPDLPAVFIWLVNIGVKCAKSFLKWNFCLKSLSYKGWDSLLLFGKMAINHLLVTYFIIKVPSEKILADASHMQYIYISTNLYSIDNSTGIFLVFKTLLQKCSPTFIPTLRFHKGRMHILRNDGRQHISV